MRTALFALAAALAADAAAADRVIFVHGRGALEVPADRATLRLSLFTSNTSRSSVAALKARNLAAAERLGDRLAAIGGRQVSVEVEPTMSDLKTRRGPGNAWTTLIVTLRGEGAIRTKLDRLYDAAVRATDSPPVVAYTVTEQRRAKAGALAGQTARVEGRTQALIQLAPGERIVRQTPTTGLNVNAPASNTRIVTVTAWRGYNMHVARGRRRVRRRTP